MRSIYYYISVTNHCCLEKNLVAVCVEGLEAVSVCALGAPKEPLSITGIQFCLIGDWMWCLMKR